MGRVSRSLPALLLHVNLFLMLFAGATLATAARLKWDPSLYIAVRELFPNEYLSIAVALTTIGFTVMLLAHIAIIALRRRAEARRVLLVMYATVMGLCIWCEVWWSLWLGVRIRRWMMGPSAADIRQAVTISDDLRPLLQHLTHFHPLPEKIHGLMEEAKKDLPRNGYVMGFACGTMLVMQVLAVALALGVGLAGSKDAPAPRRTLSLTHSTGTTYTPLSMRKGDDKAPLRTAYKSGRLVLV